MFPPHPHPQPQVLLAVSSAVTAEAVNIIDVHSQTHRVGGESAFQYKVQVSSREQAERMMAVLSTLDDVVSVLRGDMDDMLRDNPATFWEYACEDPHGS